MYFVCITLEALSSVLVYSCILEHYFTDSQSIPCWIATNHTALFCIQALSEAMLLADLELDTVWIDGFRTMNFNNRLGNYV